jgi:hypothetical protein
MLPPQVMPLASALFGIGMTVGQSRWRPSCRRAHPTSGIVAGYGCALIVLAAPGASTANLRVLFPALLGVDATKMAGDMLQAARSPRLRPPKRRLPRNGFAPSGLRCAFGRPAA